MTKSNGWALSIATFTTRRPWFTIILILVITGWAGYIARDLSVNMQMSNMFPEDMPGFKSYMEVQDRFSESNTMVALEGPRDRIVEFAKVLAPKMEEMGDFYYVTYDIPKDFFLDYGIMSQKPSDLERSLSTFRDPDLSGTFRGINDDYEKEYTDDEGNLRRDEVEIASSMLGSHRAFEVLYANLSGDPDAPPVEEAVDAMLMGDPYNLSLDRQMLLIMAAPTVSYLDQDSLLVIVQELADVVDEVKPMFPDVEATPAGYAPLQLEETKSMSQNTVLLSLLALLAIYLLLAYNFRGLFLPILAMIPLLVGIFWTMAVLKLLFGSLNIFTAMIMLILIGLGIDFSIHMVSRFYEERAKGESVLHSAKDMLGGTGIGVLTGGLTTAAAFLTLVIADTKGIYQLGISSAMGVILTIIAVFVTLPALLAIRERIVSSIRRKRGLEDSVTHASGARRGMPIIGSVAQFSWNHSRAVLAVFIVLILLSILGATQNGFLWDVYELEPKGLKCVEIVREIPDRFGASNESAWVIISSVEECRDLKEELRDLPIVGDVTSISDLIPAPEWIEQNTVELAHYRQYIQSVPVNRTVEPDYPEELSEEINRYWDNLDLMGNLAFQSGVDRVVKVIDDMTGYDSKADTTNPDAILPKLTGLIDAGIDPVLMQRVAQEWRTGMHNRLTRMSNSKAAGIDDLPENYRSMFLPRDGGDGYLFLISPRKLLFNKEDYMRFTDQVNSVNPEISGSPQMMIEMMIGALRDGAEGGIFALIAIVILLFLHFRGPVGLLAIIPLLGGASFMLGMMYLIGMKYNYFNFIAMPIILGIGIDSGVHALHRFKEFGISGAEGIRNSFSFVGRAILLSSLTTMIGFGNLAFYSMRAISSFGILLFMGVGFCFIVTIGILPAVMNVFLNHKPRILSDDNVAGL